VVDRSNSFLLDDAGFEGLWDLVERSYKPIQELAWASIGNVLTSIEIRRAMERDMVTPWKNWSGEKPKQASDIHAADRGGFIFSPSPGVYEDVHECDFSSMYPNIMIEHNISPETVRCECCDNSRIPELEWTACEERTGFIPLTLWKLVADRQRWKHELSDQSVEGEGLQAKIDALKWLLVSCYGYMGHAHASYGAIKCHQAINAHAREMLRDAKQEFESSGWRVEHGIIDSIWVGEEDSADGVMEVCERVTADTGIELEHERRFDWCAFVPRKSDHADIGSLNRYFGVSDGEVVAAGIETEQRSTPAFVKEAQREMIEALDVDMDPDHVLRVLKHRIDELESGEVDPGRLEVERRVTKTLEGYSSETRSTAAIRRARRNGFDVSPGQSVSYVVRDDSAAPLDRVRLGFEAGEYDTGFYTDLLVRATESVLSPIGYDRSDIRSELSGSRRGLERWTLSST
jgi:DNA polymerase I